MTLQVLVIRLVGISAGSSEYAFSMVVSVFILMLALGARKLATQKVITTRLWTNQLAAVAGLLLILVTAPSWPYVSHVVRTLFSFQGPAFYLYHLALLTLCGAVLFLSVAAMGRTMPLLFHTCRTRLDDLGQDVGTLYTWNTLGCLAGALIGGYAAFYVLNLEGVLRICAALLLTSVPMACLMEHQTLLRRSFENGRRMAGSTSSAVVAARRRRTSRPSPRR